MCVSNIHIICVYVCIYVCMSCVYAIVSMYVFICVGYQEQGSVVPS